MHHFFFDDIELVKRTKAQGQDRISGHKQSLFKVGDIYEFFIHVTKLGLDKNIFMRMTLNSQKKPWV